MSKWEPQSPLEERRVLKLLLSDIDSLIRVVIYSSEVVRPRASQKRHLNENNNWRKQAKTTKTSCGRGNVSAMTNNMQSSWRSLVSSLNYLFSFTCNCRCVCVCLCIFFFLRTIALPLPFGLFGCVKTRHSRPLIQLNCCWCCWTLCFGCRVTLVLLMLQVSVGASQRCDEVSALRFTPMI